MWEMRLKPPGSAWLTRLPPIIRVSRGALGLAIAMLSMGTNLRSEEAHRTEVLVYGEAPAAVAAAVQSARMGRDTLLAIPGAHVGGILANGLGSNDLDNHDFNNSIAVGGIAAEYYSRIAEWYGEGKGYRAEPHVAERTFEAMLKEAGVRVLRGHRLVEGTAGVEMKSRRLRRLHFENGRSVEAEAFVDGTVEGDLMAFAGVSYAIGREGNAAYGETLNGIVADSTHRQFLVGVDPYWERGDPSSGLIPTIQDEPVGEDGAGDDSIMGFCFRLALTNVASNRLPVPEPEGYDPRDYEIYARYFENGGGPHFFHPRPRIPNGKTDKGSWHDLSANLYGYNHGWPDGSYAERQAIFEFHRLIWFLQNDPRAPEEVAKKWADWGLPRDEFADHGHWPRQLYVRSGRRMISDWIVTEADLTAGSPKRAEDPVAVAYWPPDMHHARRLARDGKAWNEGFVFGKGIEWRPFGISYRAVRPKAEECLNLLVPAALSSSYVGYGAVRLEWTFMALGQSAGAAAALAVRDGLPVQEVPYAELEAALLQAEQVLRLP